MLPSLEEQHAIATVLSDMDAEITALEQRRDKTRMLKQGMMQQLLSGKTQLASYAAGSSGSVGARLSEISGFITKGATPTTYGYRWQDSGVLFLRSECVSPHGLDLRPGLRRTRE